MAIIIIFLWRPIRRYRITRIQGERISPLILCPEFILRRAQIDPNFKNIHYILISNPVANTRVADMIREHFILFDKQFFSKYYKIAFSPDNVQFSAFFEQIKTSDFAAVFQKTEPVMQLFEETKKVGEAFLKSKGIGPDDFFVCFANRDPSYLDTAFPLMNWDYHNYRDSSILNYIDAMNIVVEKGGYVIRMGARVSEKLPEYLNDSIIDYASGFRSEDLDIYLLAKCKFLIVGNTGISSLAAAFNVPHAFVNTIPFTNLEPFNTQDLCAPKLIWSHNKNRILSFDECYDLGLFDPNSATAGETEFYTSQNLQPVENTNKEIGAITIEMFDRLDGKTSNPKQKAQQDKFKQKYRKKIKNYILYPDIPASFLKMHKNLIV
jgi:putative glycosyltransferase (TIGR04372 family)